MSSWRFRDGGGPLSVYELPSTVQDYVIGADVAEGLGHGDASSAHVLCIQTGLVAAHWHGRIPADDFGAKLAELGWFYNTALVGCEANSHGLTTNTKLKQLRYPRIYRSRTLDKFNNQIGERMGWYTSRTSKPMMIDDLGSALQQGEIEVRDAPTIEELLQYVRDDRGRMKGSPHDDRVISLAIAVQMLKFAHAKDYAPDEQRPRYSMEWWREQAREATKPEVFYLGQGVTRS
jgi:hypothetical protein